MHKVVPCSCWLKHHGKFLSETQDLDEFRGFPVFQQAPLFQPVSGHWFLNSLLVGLCQKRTGHGYVEQKADSKEQHCDCLTLSVSPSSWDLYKSVATSSVTDSKAYLHTQQQEPV